MAEDSDVERIKFRKANNARANIEFSVGSDTNFPEDQCDIVFMSSVLHWVVDKGTLYQQMRSN